MPSGLRQPVQLALLGCGRFGWRHLEALSRIPDAQVVVVADIDEPRARQTAQRFGVSSYTTDYREAIEYPGADAVDICLPTYLHSRAVMQAAQAGRHVFCEKPLALTLDEAVGATQACERAGVKLQVGFCRRFDNAWLAAADVVRSGQLGRPVVWRHATGTSGAPQPWFFDREKGGGPFIDGAIHWYDFGLYLFGPVQSVVASTRILRPARTAPDTGVVSVRFASGDELQLLWSWGLPAGVKVDELHEIIGPEGALTMRQRPPLAGVERVNGVAEEPGHGAGGAHGANGVDPGSSGYLWLQRSEDPSGTPVVYTRNSMVEDELASFVQAVRDGTDPLVGGPEALRALEIALAVLESGETGRAVTLWESWARAKH